MSGAEPQSVTECQGYTNKVKTALCLKNIKQPDADAFCNGRQKAIRSRVDPEGRWCENTQRRLLSALSPFGLCPTVGAETRQSVVVVTSDMRPTHLRLFGLCEGSQSGGNAVMLDLFRLQANSLL